MLAPSILLLALLIQKVPPWTGTYLECARLGDNLETALEGYRRMPVIDPSTAPASMRKGLVERAATLRATTENLEWITGELRKRYPIRSPDSTLQQDQERDFGNDTAEMMRRVRTCILAPR